MVAREDERQRSVAPKQRVDMGFMTDEVVVMNVTAPSWRYESSEERGPLYDDLLERLSTLPGVVQVARASAAPPRSGVLFGTVEIEGEEPSEDTKVMFGPFIREGYFETLGQQIVRGRTFTADDLAGEEGLMLVSEGTGRALFGERDPVGARFRTGGDEEWRTVIGVVADVPMAGLSPSRDVVLQVYHPLRSNWNSQAFILRLGTGQDPAPIMALTREAAKAVDSDLRVDEVASATTLMRDTLERERFATTIMSVFAAFALLLAAVGLYGVVSQVVGQRTREIGIRMALGARQASIASMVLRRAGGATLAGIAVGIALALAGTRLLESRIVGVETNSLATFALAATALSLTSLLAAYAPARRASHVDPVDAMRVE